MCIILFYIVFTIHMHFLPVVYIYIKERSFSLRLYRWLYSFFHGFWYWGLMMAQKWAETWHLRNISVCALRNSFKYIYFLISWCLDCCPFLSDLVIMLLETLLASTVCSIVLISICSRCWISDVLACCVFGARFYSVGWLDTLYSLVFLVLGFLLLSTLWSLLVMVRMAVDPKRIGSYMNCCLTVYLFGCNASRLFRFRWFQRSKVEIPTYGLYRTRQFILLTPSCRSVTIS
jgi:hypothetical protein